MWCMGRGVIGRSGVASEWGRREYMWTERIERLGAEVRMSIGAGRQGKWPGVWGRGGEMECVVACTSLYHV